MKWTVHEQVAEVEKVMTRFSWTGTLEGPFMGIPSTQQAVQVWGIVIDVLCIGVFSESRMLMDQVSLLQQLGVMK